MSKTDKAVEEVTEEVEATEPKAPKVTNIEAGESCVEPKPEGKKGIVFNAGRADGGGSIAALAESMGCTTSNIRQHIAQCHTKLGFGYTIDGDNFTITGDVTESWDDQAAAKAEKAAAVKAEKDAAKATEAPTDSEAPADTAEGGEAEDEGDDFLS